MENKTIFELFEVVCQELIAREGTILSDDAIPPSIIAELGGYYGRTSGSETLNLAMDELENHFQLRGSRLPFIFDQNTGRLDVIDLAYATFIANASNARSIGGTDSKTFEVETLNRLALRLTGLLHRVGSPRENKKRKAELESHLMELGFKKRCLEKYDKDGGFDILWLPPLGKVPVRPIVSLQCKNSFFDEGEANRSVGRARRTLNRHSHCVEHRMLFVVFNDYIDDNFVDRSAGWAFLPLGLSDLGPISTPVATLVL